MNQLVTYPLCVTIPVHGPNVNYDEIMKSLQHSSNDDDAEYSSPAQIFHFDIASSVSFTHSCINVINVLFPRYWKRLMLFCLV